MKYTRPFDLATGAESVDQAWLNANLSAGFEGSIPPAEFYHRTNSEIENAIIDSGQTPSNADLGQLSKAIILGHRLLENRTIYVPGDFDNVWDALSYLSGKIIPDDVFVTILLGAGDIDVDSSTGPILLDQPYGSRIRLQGQPLTGTGFPTSTEIDISSKPTAEAILRSRFPTRVVVHGGVKAIFMKSGMFSRLSRLCIIGDATAGQDGICIGEWQGDIGTGNISLQDVWAFNCGGRGIRANYNAAIQGNNIAGTHCISDGLQAANSSSIQSTGSVIACRNNGQGISVRDQAFVELTAGAVAYLQHNANGVQSTETGEFISAAATSLDIRNNTGAGVATTFHSYSAISMATGVTGGGNGTSDIVCSGGSFTFLNPSLSSLSCSPTVNTIGNSNAFIQR